MFSREFYKIFKNTYFEKHLRATASVNSRSTIFQESLVLPFKLNALTSRILWQHAHSNLVGIFLQFWQLCHSWEHSISYAGFLVPEAVAQVCSVKKVFLEILQNSQENTCVRVFFSIKFFKKETLAQLLYSEFCNFVILRALFFTEHLWWVLLWFILVASIIVTWVSWFSRHRFKLEAEDFISHILQRNFPNFSMKILALCLAKSLRSFYFSLFRSQLVYTCSKYGIVQSLVKTFLKHIFFLFLFTSGI